MANIQSYKMPRFGEKGAVGFVQKYVRENGINQEFLENSDVSDESGLTAGTEYTIYESSEVTDGNEPTIIGHIQKLAESGDQAYIHVNLKDDSTDPVELDGQIYLERENTKTGEVERLHPTNFNLSNIRDKPVNRENPSNQGFLPVIRKGITKNYKWRVIYIPNSQADGKNLSGANSVFKVPYSDLLLKPKFSL